MSLEVKVVFRAEGAKNVISAIQQLRGEEQKLSNTTGATKKQFDRLEQALNNNTKATNKLADSKKEAAKQLGIFGRQTRLVRGFLARMRSIMLLAAFTANVFRRTVGAASDAAMEQANAVAQLNQTLKSTKFQSNLTSRELTKFAAALQKVTGIGDETIISMQGILLTFTKIRGEIFKEATEVILDISVALGQDLQQSAIQVGKALNDPLLGMSALSRVGIQFDKEQKQSIKTFVRQNDIAAAQGVILKELQVQFGGTAKNIDKNVLSFRKLHSASGDFLEVVGKPLSDFFAQVADFTTNILENFTDQSEENYFRVFDALDTTTKQGALSLKDFGNEFDLISEIIGETFTPDMLKDASKYNEILEKMDKRTSDLLDVQKPQSQVFNALVGQLNASGIELGEFISDVEEGIGAFQVNRFVKDIKEQFGEAAPEILKARKDLSDIIMRGGGARVITPEELPILIDLINSFGGKIVDSTKLGETSVFTDIIKDIVDGQVKFVDAAGQQIAITGELKTFLMELAAGYGTAGNESEKFFMKMAKLNDAQKENIKLVDDGLQGFLAFAQGNKQATIALLKLRKALAIANVILGFTAELSKGIAGLPSAFKVLGAGMAQIGAINEQISAARASSREAAMGADFITNGRQLLTVGDNPTGRERVQVTPLGNTGGAGGGDSSVTINLNGNILGSEEFVRDELIPQIENAVGRNLA